MRKISLLCATIACFALLFSCQKKELIEPETLLTQQDVYVENGYLVFKDQFTFIKTLEELDTMDESEISGWLVEKEFYESLFFKFKEAKEFEGETKSQNCLLPEDIKDQSYSALLNIDGIFAIGDTISFLTRDIEYIITNGEYSIVEKIKENKDYENKNLIKHYYKQRLKGSYGLTNYYNYNIELEIEGEVWMDVYFWVHSAHVEIDLVHKGDTNNNVRMASCSMNVSAEFAETKEIENASYTTFTSSGTYYDVMQYDRKIYRRGWQTDWFCGRNVVVTGSVQKKGDGTDPVVNYTFNWPDLGCVTVD